MGQQYEAPLSSLGVFLYLYGFTTEQWYKTTLSPPRTTMTPLQTHPTWNANEDIDNLPETAADIEFKRVLASAKANVFELHCVKARKLYKAAIAEAHMNNSLALKIRASIANAVNRYIEGQNDPLYFHKPILVENEYLHFHRHSDSWIQLSDLIENILTDEEYNYFFNAVAIKMQDCITEGGHIRGPGPVPLLNAATICGFSEWYLKHDFAAFLSSSEFWRIQRREVCRKILAHIRLSTGGRLAIYQTIQILWCMWKFTSTREEMFTLLLACVVPNLRITRNRDVGMIFPMLLQFSFFSSFILSFLRTCWTLLKYLFLIGVMLNLFPYIVQTIWGRT